MDRIRAGEFLDKARKKLDWNSKFLTDMHRSATLADFDEVERNFVAILHAFDAIHQALVDAAKELDMQAWREALNSLRETDSLLHYLWLARNADAHNAVVMWLPAMKQQEAKIVDARKFNALTALERTDYDKIQRAFLFIYGVNSVAEATDAIKNHGAKPSADRLQQIGLELTLTLDTFALRDFKSGRHSAKAPDKHLGKLLPPSASVAAVKANEFYLGKLGELEAALR